MDATEKQIVDYLNRVIQKQYISRPGVSRIDALDIAWFDLKQKRENQGRNDVVTVSVEHYLWTRLQGAKGLFTTAQQMILIPGYAVLKIFGLAPKTGGDLTSVYSPTHQVWEYKGLAAGVFDRLEPNLRIPLLEEGNY